MKKEVNYICEICGRKHDTEEGALECERHHVKVDCVKDVAYQGERYPQQVTIKMKDSRVKYYVLDE